MEFFKLNTNIQFMRQRLAAAIFSAVIFIASIVALMTNGLTLGLDFTGGTQLTFSFEKNYNIHTIREELKNSVFEEAIVLPYGKDELSVRIGVHDELSQEALKEKMGQLIPDGKIVQSEYIGPQIGKQLLTNGILAIVLVFIGIMIYISLRFEYRFAVSATVALIHDPILILGIFSFFHIEFNMIGLTAVLTVIGYSINDTIVVYDRVRECFRQYRKKSPLEIMDLSINQTLSRTIMTSGLTLIVVIALFIYGGESIHAFALALMIGIVIGTYSSIYIAGSLAVVLGLNRNTLLPAAKLVDDRP